ncbi:MAG: FecR family protein [Spirochaetota bacterium]
MKKAGLISLAAILAIAVSCSKPANVDYASVSFFIGEVTKNGAAVNIGDIVSEKDSISTGTLSSCDIKMGDSIIRVKEKSKMVFSSLGIKNNLEKTTLDLGEGRMLCKPKKLLKSESFTVKTPTAVAAVRGTEFTVETDSNKTTRIKVYDGKVKVAKRVKQLEDRMDTVIEASSAVETQESVIITQKETADAEKIVEKALADNKGADISLVIEKVKNDVAVGDKGIESFKVEDFKQESNELITVKEKEPEVIKQIEKIVKEEKPAPEGRLFITRFEIYFINNGRVEWEGNVIAPPVRSKDKIYIASDDYIFCASAEGPVLWKKQIINDGKVELKDGAATIFIKGSPLKLDAETGKDRL